MVIKYCYDMGVVYRDIKSDNVFFIFLGSLKFVDFGLVVRIFDGKWIYVFIWSNNVVFGWKCYVDFF